MPEKRQPEIPVRFYRTASGREVVLEWMRGLAVEDRQTIGQDLMRAQYRWPIGMPLMRSLKDGLWELRSTLPGGTIARLLLVFHDQTLIVLTGFIKKTQKTPRAEIEVALRRLKEVSR